MKNMYKILALTLFINECIGQQANIFDSKSITVPKYTNQTAIGNILSPTEGALVYDIAQDKFAYYTGTAWVNFPGTSSPSSSAGIVVPTISVVSELSVAPLNAAANGSLVYLPSSARYYLRADAQWQEVNPSSSFWNVSGNAISNTTQAIQIGTNSNTLSANLAISNQNASSTNPDILFQSNATTTPNNVIKYIGRSGSVNNSIFTQTVQHNNAFLSSMNWQYTNASNVTTTVFKGGGNQEAARFYGFTNIGSGSPAVKIRLYTGTTNATAGATTAIVHGIDASKIIDVSCVITGTINSAIGYILMADGVTANASNSYKITYDGTNINIVPTPASTSTMNNKSYKLLVTYTN